MDLARDIERLMRHEQVLRFPRFDAATAWSLGSRLKALAEARGVAIAVEVRLAGETVFFYAMPGTAPANADWARRKRNSVELLQQSSYRIGRELQRDGGTLDSKMGLPARDYASHGGCFPLFLDNGLCIGNITVSGLPQRDDHMLVVHALAEQLGLDPAGLALD